jgi:phospholipid-translocating ATPase
MIIWISIYSAFESVDFNDEVIILYGSITFWGTVIFTVVVALGM